MSRCRSALLLLAQDGACRSGRSHGSWGKPHRTGTIFAGSAHMGLFARSLIRVESSDPPLRFVSDCLNDGGVSPLADGAGREKERERREVAMVDDASVWTDLPLDSSWVAPASRRDSLPSKPPWKLITERSDSRYQPVWLPNDLLSPLMRFLGDHSTGERTAL